MLIRVKAAPARYVVGVPGKLVVAQLNKALLSTLLVPAWSPSNNRSGLHGLAFNSGLLLTMQAVLVL